MTEIMMARKTFDYCESVSLELTQDFWNSDSTNSALLKS
jgi:hypothetical protein